jgi:hypothetical protein
MTLLSSTQGRPGAAVDLLLLLMVAGCVVVLLSCRASVVLWKGGDEARRLGDHHLSLDFLFFLKKVFVYMESLDFIFP